jgi:hypothetical protein
LSIRWILLRPTAVTNAGFDQLVLVMFHEDVLSSPEAT